jgi:uncharacterized protein
MSPNKKVIEKYFDSLSKMDRPALLSCLTDDVERVEWADGFPNSGVPVRGRAAFNQSIGDPPGGNLQIETTRRTEENNIVVAESIVRVPMKEGGFLTLQACNIFELENGKIKRVNSFTAEVKNSP